MRKSLVVYLVAMLIFTNSQFCVFRNIEAKENCAFTQEEIKELVSSYIGEKKLYDSKSLYYIGERIQVYDIRFDKDIYQLDERESTWFYPVYKGDEIILTVLIMGETCKISTDGVEGMNYLYQKHQEPVLVCESMHCYAFAGDTQILIDEDPYSNTDFITDRDSETFSQIKELASKKEGYKYRRSQLKVKQSEQTKSGTIISNFPVISQYPYSNGCWAACMACFIKKYGGVNATASTVITTIGCGNVTRTYTQVISYLDSYYDIVAYSGTLNASYIRSNISNNKAYIIGWSYTYYDPVTMYQATANHMTCLYGYETSGSGYKYYIMDPNGSNNNIASTYTLTTSSSSALPTNNKIYTTIGGSTGTGYTYSMTSAIAYDYTR